MRKLLLFFAMLFVSVGTWAAITISSANVTVGGTQYSGYGIYGAQAVAEEHFNTDASELTKAQCALIAATLPNPRKFSSKNPSGYMYKRQGRIMREMKYVDKLSDK